MSALFVGKSRALRRIFTSNHFMTWKQYNRPPTKRITFSSLLFGKKQSEYPKKESKLQKNPIKFKDLVKPPGSLTTLSNEKGDKTPHIDEFSRSKHNRSSVAKSEETPQEINHDCVVSIPPISEELPSCQVYLEEILKTIRPEPSFEDWEFLLGEIIGTLRANVEIPSPVTELSRDGFVLDVCLKVQAYHAAISYVEFIRSRSQTLSNVGCVNFMILMASCESSLLRHDQGLGIRFKKIYDELLCQDLTAMKEATYKSLIWAVANTPDWRKALDCYKSTTEPKSPVVFKSLAMAALAERDYDTFWEILDTPQFIPKELNIRSEENSECHPRELTLLAFLEHLAALVDEGKKILAWDLFSKLLQRFRDTFYCADVKVESALMTLSQKICKGEKQQPTQAAIKAGHCTSCSTLLERSSFSSAELESLKEAVLKKVLCKDNIYKSSDPSELSRFQSFLDASKGYDVIVDGLNVALARWPGVRHKHLHAQSLSLLKTVQALKEIFPKILIVHRDKFDQYKDAREIRRLANVVTLSKVTEDDPFMLLAALGSKSKTYFVTNDSLRQHYFCLDSFQLRMTFTKWQVSRQIYHFQKVSYLKNRDEINVFLAIPPDHAPHACSSPTHWHLPCVGPVSEDEKAAFEALQRISFPKKWICLPKPKCC